MGAGNLPAPALIDKSDAEAAKGIASRTGLGTMRHLAVHYLWVQERVRAGEITLHRVRGVDNPADS